MLQPFEVSVNLLEIKVYIQNNEMPLQKPLCFDNEDNIRFLNYVRKFRPGC